MNRIAVPCLDCGKIADKRSRCDACNRKRERERGSSTARGYGAEWRRIRIRILRRDPTCRVPTGVGGYFDNGVPWQQVCGAPSKEVDHVTPKVLGGTDDYDNLRAVCRFHNRSKGARVA